MSSVFAALVFWSHLNQCQTTANVFQYVLLMHALLLNLLLYLRSYSAAANRVYVSCSQKVKKPHALLKDAYEEETHTFFTESAVRILQ